MFPEPGMDDQYDTVIEKIKEVDAELKSYLKEQCKHFGCNVRSYYKLSFNFLRSMECVFFMTKVQYTGTDKKRYQLEVPEGASKRAGDGYELQSTKKNYKRFTTARTKVWHIYSIDFVIFINLYV